VSLLVAFDWKRHGRRQVVVPRDRFGKAGIQAQPVFQNIGKANQQWQSEVALLQGVD